MKRVNTILKALPSVQNMVSNKGNEIPNQFEVYFKEGSLFQSYGTIIAVRLHDGRILLDKRKWDYSKTTGTYRNIYLREGIAETRAKIDNGVYKLVDLN